MAAKVKALPLPAQLPAELSSPNAAPRIGLMDSCISLNVLASGLGVSKTFIYDAMAAGEFPKPLNFGGRSVRWLASEVNQWLADRMAAREVKS